MENAQSLMANLSDEQVEEYRLAKYPPSIRSWGDQEAEARKIRRQQAEVALQAMFEAEKVKDKANKVFVATADKVLGSLPEYSLDWRTNPTTQAVHIYTVEVEDTDKPEVVEANGNKELRYPKKLIRRVEVGVQPTQVGNNKPATKATKGESRSIVVKFLRGESFETVGTYDSGEAGKADIIDSKHQAYYPGIGYADSEADSAPRNIARNGYYVYDTDGKLKYAPRG